MKRHTLNDSLEKVINKFSVNGQKSPIQIPNYDRNSMADLFNELGFHVGAEVGVECGLYSKVLCERIPGLHLYCIDAWKAYKGYRDHVNQEKLEGFFETTKQTLSPYNVTIIRKFSMDAIKDIPDGSLDFVYIDANHTFQSVTNDIAEWAKKVRIGGIVSGHDYHTYYHYRNIHVVDVVNAWTAAYRIHPWFIAGTKEKPEGMLRDRVRSWFWIKQ